MNSSILNVKVSCFKNYYCKSPSSTVDLLSWVTSHEYADKVKDIRKVQDEELQKIYKASLPLITPSGLFTYGSTTGFIEHSGFLAFDIDFKDNKTLENYGDLKEQISHIPNIAYLGLSVRGKGLWGLLPIPKCSPEIHQYRFQALAEDFAEYNVKIDSAGSNIAVQRTYSFDPKPYFNHSAKVYTKLPKLKKTNYVKPPFTDNRRRVESIISQIKIKKVDITQAYKEEWFKIASALANEFGEGGRGYFHEISQFHPKYCIKETDRMFDGCLKHNYTNVTIGSFFYIASEYGIMPDEFDLTELGITKVDKEVRHVTSTTQDPIVERSEARASQTSVKQKQPERNGEWDKEIIELEKFFDSINLPVHPIKLNDWTLITNLPLFVGSSFDIIKSQNGKKVFEPYLERLILLKKRLSQN